MTDLAATAELSEPITSAVNTVTWFHSTPEDDIDTFWPLSHFGSEHVAIARYANLFFSGDVSNPGTLIEVCLALDSQRVWHMPEDWGWPNPPGFALAMRNHGPLHARPHFETLRKSMVNSGSLVHLSPLEKRERLSDAMMKYGLDALTYFNEVEGQQPSLSICVTNPEVIEKVSVRTLSERELSLAIDPDDLRILISDWDRPAVRMAILKAREGR